MISNNNKLLIIFFFIAFVIINFQTSIHFAFNIFSHPDETSVVERILDEKEYSALYLEKKNNLSKNKNIGFKFKIANYLDELGILKPLFKFFLIPINATQAPLPYILMYPLINENNSFYENLLYSKTLPIITSILSTVILFFFLKKFFFDKELIFFALIPSFLLSVSFEKIIFSQSLMNYPYGIFSFIIMLLILLNSLSDKNNKSVLNFFILFLLCLTNYQIIFFLPAYYLTIYFFNFNLFRYETYLKRRIYQFSLEPLLLLFLIILFLLPFINLQWSGYNDWTLGINKQFDYNLSNFTNFYDKFIFSLNFFLINFGIVFIKISSFTSENSFLHYPIGYIYIILFCIGLIDLFISKNESKKFVSFFIICIFISYFFLIYFNKVPLSPTRHNLILLVLFVFVSNFGIFRVYTLLNIYFKLYLQRFFPIIIILIISSIFYLNFFNELKNRTKIINNDELIQIINVHKINKIFSYGAYYEPRLINDIYYEKEIFLSYFHYMLNYYNKRNNTFLNYKISKNQFVKLSKNENILFISNRFPLDEDHILFLFEKYQIQSELFKLTLLDKKEISTKYELEYSNLTNNGSNDIYYYIYKVIK